MSKIILLAVCVTLAVAYDFKDSAFNQLLLNDILELSESADTSVLHRITRAAENPSEDECKKKRVRGFHCCNDKYDATHWEILKGLKKECVAELHGNDSDIFFKFDPFTCDKLEQLKKDIACVTECVGKKIGVMTDAGEVNREEFLKQLKTKFSDSEWQANAAEGILDKCMEEAKKEVAADTTSEKTCNPTGIKIAQCIWREYVRSCPKDLQMDTPKCNKLREKIEKGDTVSYKGFYLRHLNDE